MFRASIPPVNEGRLRRAAGIGLGTVAMGLVLRTYIGLVMPLPPDWWWLALVSGLGQDLAVASALTLVGMMPWRVARIAEGALATVILCAFALWAEAVVYFGHPPRRAELSVGLQSDMLVKSWDVRLVVRLAIFLAVFAAAALLASRVLTRSPSRSLCLVVCATVVLAIGAAMLLRPTPAADAFRNPVFTFVDFASEKRGGGGSSWRKPTARPGRLTAVRELAPQIPARAYVSADFPLAHRRVSEGRGESLLPAGLKPNVVFLVMEGVRAHEVGAYGGTVPGLTPNIDRLSARGVRVDRAYSPGTLTPEGELALWYGLLALPNSLVVTDWPRTRLGGLPEALRAAGWRSFLWIHNSEQTFYREAEFYLPRGFRIIDGRDFPEDDPATNWGKSDRVLMQRALVALDRLPEPFAAMVLTISNHHPFQVPPDARSTLDLRLPERRGYEWVTGFPAKLWHHTVPMLRTVHYTDEAVGAFFDSARGREWFGRTIFVLTSDHGLPVVPLEGMTSAHQFSELRHRVPLIFLGPSLPEGHVVPGPASLADVPSTLLGLARVDGVRAGVGADLMDPDAESHDRPVIAWDNEARRVTVVTKRFVYHATLGPETRPGAVSLQDEELHEAAAPPGRSPDVASREPLALEAHRRLAGIYLDLYPSVVTGGRSGTPPPPTR